jgi:hypothetical protein
LIKPWQKKLKGYYEYIFIKVVVKLKINTMPFRDETGPLGLGPGTGWGLGPCGGGRAWKRVWGRGLGYGRGFGWKRFWAYPYQPIKKEEEKELLEKAMADLEEELKTIKERLSQLKDQKN